MNKKLLLRSKNILFTCFLLLIAISSNAQPDAKYSWAKGFTNRSIASIAAVATDDSGNVYSAGFYDSSLVSLNIASKGSSDILLMKHNASGTLKWVKTIATTSFETADGIAIDANQNIYIVGRFEATTDFDPGTGTANLTPKGGLDIFMAKYTSNGDYVWAKGIGGASTEAANKIVVDASGNVYITGLFNATVDFNPAAGVANLTSNVITTYDAFFAKYTTNGIYVWAKSIGNSGDDRGYGIAIDASSNVYIAGEFQGTADFNPSSTAINNLTAAGTNDMFYAKYDANGAYVWAKRVGTASNYVSARDIKLDADNNIYVVGVFETNTDFDPSTNIAIVNSGGVFTGFVAKYNSLGNYVWAFGNGGSGSIYNMRMCMDKLKSVYVTGNFNNTCDFDPSTATANLTSAGNDDVYLAKYDTDGKYKWAKRIGNTGIEDGGGIAVDTSFNVFVSGYYTGTVDFDPSAATANLSSVTGTSSAFVAKYTQTGICFPISTTFTVTACNSYTWAEKGNKVYTVSNTTDTIHLITAGGCDSLVTLNLTINRKTVSYNIVVGCNSYAWNGTIYTTSKNDSFTTTNAKGCDSTAYLYLTLNYNTSSVTNIATCSSYVWNGTTYTNSGTYTYHTLNANGCDSTATLVLTIKAKTISTTYLNICQSQLPYTINGLTFTEEGKQSTILTNANGCDSLATYILSTVYGGVFDFATILQPMCDSSFGSITAKYYEYRRVFRGTIDSTDQKQTGRLNITAQPTSSCSVSSTNPGLVSGDTKQRFFESYTLTNTTGATACISVNLINYNLSNSYTVAAYTGSFNPANPSQNYLGHLGHILALGNDLFYFTVPANASFEIVVSNYNTGNFFGNYTLEVRGLETQEFSINNGLSWQNSTIFSNATIGNNNLKMRTKGTQCEVEYFHNPIVINAKTNTSSTTNLSVCPSALPYIWNGLTFTAAGSQTKTGLLNSQGCDSSATLNLIVKTNTSSTSNLSVCPSALPYIWNGLTFTAAGSQTKNGLVNSQGCDSSATLNLIVKTNTSSTQNLSICLIALPYSWNGLTFTAAGSQTKTGLINSQGCDSSATLNLTIKALPNAGVISGINNFCRSAGSTTLTSNGGAGGTWSSNNSARVSVTSLGKVTATLGGNYIIYYIVTNTCGTDTARFNITVNVPSSETISTSACASYTWGGTTYTTSGTYTKTGLINKYGCDSSATLNLTIKTNTSSTTNLSVCPSALPYSWNGLTFTVAGSQTKNGLINSQGCDSSATLNLTVKTNTSSTTNLSICPSQLPYSWNGLTFTATGSQTKTGLTNSQGCDSSATLNLTVKTNTNSTQSLAICPSALPYSWNGLTFTAAGSQTKTGLPNSQGCDSSATLNLSVKTNTSSTANLSICPSQLPYSWNGLSFTTAGSQTKNGLINSQGCDSSATLNLSVKTNTSSTNNLSICPSQLPYSWNGLSFTAAGSQTKTGLPNSQGCDSSATLNLSVKTNTSSTANLSICPSQLPYSWNGLSFTTAGSQTKNGLINSQGCDSSATLNLSVKTNTSSTNNLSICPSQLPYSWNGLSFTAAGSQTKTGLVNSQGCDSSATLNLSVKTNTSSTNNLSICPSQLPYSWNGLSFTAAGSQTKTGLTNSQGCDSTATLNLSVKTNTSSTSNLSICPSQLPYSWNGLTFTTAGSQTKTGLTNSLGCDSSATLNLTVKTNTSSTTNLSICPSQLPYSWNGLSFTAAGSQTKTGLTNSQGCDSSATLNLTVKTNTSSTTNLSICPSALPYSWNGLTFNSAGSQTKNGLTNSQGCDSSATLNLTVKTVTYSTLNNTICSGQTYLGHSTTGSFNDTLVNSVGCDSIRTLNLTVIQSVTPTISIATALINVCKGYTVSFNTSSSNQGTNAIYQWYKNGIAVGANSNVYKDSLLNNQDSIWCVLTSSETCVTANNIKSNLVKMNVSLAITGSIRTPIGNSIPRVTVYRTGSIIDTQLVNNKYNSSCINTTNSVTLRPSKNNDLSKANGINTTDVLFVQRHILNTTKLNSAYKLIAADVNGDKNINATDLLRIKRLILGTDTTFTSATKGNRLWEFVDSAYQFPDTTNPFPFKDSISFTNLTSNKINQTFIAVKLGDVNYDWNPAVAKGIVTKPVELQYTISNKQLTTANEELGIWNSVIKIPITANNFNELVAMQYTLHFDNSKYEFVGIENNKLDIDFNQKQCNQNGNISFLWTDKNAVERTLEDGTELFTLVLTQKGIGNLELAISDAITDIAAWDKDYNQHNIILTKRETINDKQETRNESFSVSPNPTSGIIKISITSKINKTVSFELTDAQGKAILKQAAELQKGNNSFILNLKQNGNLTTGIYFLKAVGFEGDNVRRIMVK